ncbi:interleukin-18 receptor accessory protein-like [Hemiscyllium ocellatum]|uniref:interleukin-18 receptor accessory protein-like n=1 Tax=Hemiscyllium ocellatum TaxID=170820 RepID=UPI00296695C6|nr:interleukin-18 receptor accessory protein-like [Hemiscyllium ocellatum]
MAVATEEPQSFPAAAGVVSPSAIVEAAVRAAIAWAAIAEAPSVAVIQKDGKEFDAFVSYANTSSLGEDDESNSYIITEEKFALELLPNVLEKQHGYKLCLFERDILPGGVYTEDVISCIKRSRRVIIVLSPNYIARNDSRIFELQTGVSSMLDNYKTKVILIKFHSLPDRVDLPENVKKAITVLPEITWKGKKSFPPSSNFWKMLRYHMPVKKNNIVTSQSFN